MAGPNLVVIGDVMLDVMVSSGGLVRGAVDAGSWALVERRGRTAFFEATRPATVLFANEREAEALVGARGRAACRLAAGPHTRIVRLRPGAVDKRPRDGGIRCRRNTRCRPPITWQVSHQERTTKDLLRNSNRC
jgi:hypothetical protein